MSAHKSATKERRLNGVVAQEWRPLHKLSALFCVLLIARGQMYIASTLAGSRPRMRVDAGQRDAVGQSVDAAWEECAQILGEGLTDVGDAGRIWREHAYVGTNRDPTDKSVRRPLRIVDEFDKFKCRCERPEMYADRKPLLTAIVQSFNHHANIGNISTALRRSAFVQEIIVSEDGSTDGSVHDWQRVMTEDTHFIVRSNNLQELRSYNRAMRIASGDVVVLLRDDDLLPISDQWVRDALRLFKALPKLGVLGGFVGQMWDHATGQSSEFSETVGWQGEMTNGATKPLPYIEPTTGLPFMYAECAWLGPLFIRSSLLKVAGGLELTIAKRGEPGVWQDCVFSYETWVHGYTVGVYGAPFERGLGDRQLKQSEAKVKQREKVLNRAVAYADRKFPRRRIHHAIKSLSNGTLTDRWQS